MTYKVIVYDLDGYDMGYIYTDSIETARCISRSLEDTRLVGTAIVLDSRG